MRTVIQIGVVTLLFVQVSQGQLVRQPPDLAPGDQYRLFFVTSVARDASSSDITAYDEFVQSVADSASVVGSWNLKWQAVASTDAVSARDHTGTNQALEDGVPIYRVDGKLIWVDNDHMWDPIPHDDIDARLLAGTIDTYFPEVTELGTVVPEGGFVWTGTLVDGTASVSSLPGVRNTTLGSEVGVGIQGIPQNHTNPFHQDVEHTSFEFPFYAISEVITAVPEPSGWWLLVVGVLGLRRWR